MNFLGHIFLTPADDELLLGNFVADSIKGNPERQLEPRMAEGVRFHRAIDNFTDQHPLVKQGVNRLRPTQGRYAAVVIDVIFDHILASNWSQFHSEELGAFTESIYQRLEAQEGHFPLRVKQYFPYMRKQNWLYNYQFEWGLVLSLEGLDRRSSVPTEMRTAVDVYKTNEAIFNAEFELFIADAQKMAGHYFLSERDETGTSPTPR